MRLVVCPASFRDADVELRRMVRQLKPRHDLVYDDRTLTSYDRAIVDALVWREHAVAARTVKEWRRKWPRLAMVSLAFTGVDQVNTAALRKAQISACRVADYATMSVSELALGLTLAVQRRLPLCDASVRSGRFDSGDVQPGVELYGKTVGVLGTGKIGFSVVQKFSAMGCNVIAWNRTKQKGLVAAGGRWVTRNELFRKSDVVVVSLALTKGTKRIVNARTLKLMRPSAIIINVSRAGLVDTRALAGALRRRAIAGAGIDVYDSEPMSDRCHPLCRMPTAVLTPHVGFKTTEAIGRLRRESVANIQRWLRAEQHANWIC